MDRKKIKQKNEHKKPKTKWKRTGKKAHTHVSQDNVLNNFEGNPPIKYKYHPNKSPKIHKNRCKIRISPTRGLQETFKISNEIYIIKKKLCQILHTFNEPEW